MKNITKTLNDFMPLIKSVASRYSYDADSYDEAFCEGKIALINSIEKYKEGSKIPFPYFAKMFVNSHVRHFVSKEISYNERQVSINTKIHEDICLIDTLSDGKNLEDDYMKKVTYLRLIDIIQSLKPIEREVIERHFFLGHTLKKISNDTSYSYRGIKYAKSRAVEKLKTSMKEDLF